MRGSAKIVLDGPAWAGGGAAVAQGGPGEVARLGDVAAWLRDVEGDRDSWSKMRCGRRMAEFSSAS